MTREEMINAIVDTLDNWDPEELWKYAKDKMRQTLNSSSPAQLEREYNDACVGD